MQNQVSKCTLVLEDTELLTLYKCYKVNTKRVWSIESLRSQDGTRYFQLLMGAVDSLQLIEVEINLSGAYHDY